MGKIGHDVEHIVTKHGLVSFDISKKLKEGGFKRLTQYGYAEQDGNIDIVRSNGNCPMGVIDWNKEVKFYPAASLEEMGSSKADEVAKQFIANSGKE